MTESAKVYRVGHVEDHEVTRQGLQTLLGPVPDLNLVVGAATVSELFATTTELDLVVLDLRLGDGSTPKSNIDLLHRADLKVLALTGGEDPYLVRGAARAGVLGVLPKTERAEVVIAAIRAAASGQLVPSTEWAAAIDGDPDLGEVGLSPRQREVLELYASGLTADQVARRTNLSAQTVNDYLNRIKYKYAVAGRPTQTKTDLLMRAQEDGIAPLPEPRRLRWLPRFR